MTAASGTGGVTGLFRDLVSEAQWHRRLLAAGLLAGSVALGLHTLAPEPPPGAAVVVAARDLAAGAELGADDVETIRLAPSVVPDGALSAERAAGGRSLVSAVRRGEPLTDLRLVGTPALDLLGAGHVAAPVRIADPATVRLLRAGDVVDVLAAAGDQPAAPARLVAAAVRVVSVPRAVRDTFDSGSGGGLVLLETTPSTAARLAGAAVTERLSVVLRPV